MKATQLKQNIKRLNSGIVNVPYERPIVEVVNKLMELTKAAGFSPTVQTQKHWEIVEFLFKMFYDLYPTQYKQFRKWQLRLKSDKKTKNATSREGEALIQHQLEIPRKFHDLIKAIFPGQVFDKKFSAKLGNRMPLLKVPEGNL